MGMTEDGAGACSGHWLVWECVRMLILKAEQH